MGNKRSCCCKALPPKLWWLLTLLGLPLLYFFMFSANKDPIEADLSKRVSNALASENMTWAKVSVDERGRDVLLSGEAPSKELASNAISVAKSVEGVRIADGQFSEVIATEDMKLNVEFKDGKITLTGSVSSQAEADMIVKAAIARVGEGKVVNNLTISNKIKPSNWLGALPGLIGLAQEGGSLSASAEGVKFVSTVDSPEKEASLLAKAKTLLDEFSIPLINGIIVKAPVPTESMSLQVKLKDGKLILEGEVSSQEEIDAIVSAAIAQVGEENVTNNLTFRNTVKPSAWLTHISDLLVLIPSEGELLASETDVKYTGSADTNDAQNALIDKAKGLLGSFDMNVVDGLTVVETSDSKATTTTANEVTEEVKKAINVCQNKLNATMEGKSIHFQTNAAVIQANSFDLLNEIAEVMSECRDEISRGVSINGHTDSRGNDAYNMALSLRRANAVKQYLIKQKVDSSLMKSVGHGETSPVASNDTREGQAQNRRITFIINQ